MSSSTTTFPTPPTSLTILLLGAGGREHALAWKLAQSPRVAHVLVCPGNGGTAMMGGKVENISAGYGGSQGFEEVVKLSQERKVDLIVPGPELPLVEGCEEVFRKGESGIRLSKGCNPTRAIRQRFTPNPAFQTPFHRSKADYTTAGIPVFGPSPAAALLEGSKTLSKAFMARHTIPTASFRSFTSSEYTSAASYIQSNPFSSGRCVIKASGLAAGKGVLIPESNEEALQALQSVMVDKEFGEAGDEVVIEEYLAGPEISVLAFSDGYTLVPMPAAQDHKRIGDGDVGPNTGGMGAYAPAPVATQEIMERCVKEALEPTLRGMRQDGESWLPITSRRP